MDQESCKTFPTRTIFSPRSKTFSVSSLTFSHNRKTNNDQPKTSNFTRTIFTPRDRHTTNEGTFTRTVFSLKPIQEAKDQPHYARITLNNFSLPSTELEQVEDKTPITNKLFVRPIFTPKPILLPNDQPHHANITLNNKFLPLTDLNHMNTFSPHSPANHSSTSATRQFSPNFFLNSYPTKTLTKNFSRSHCETGTENHHNRGNSRKSIIQDDIKTDHSVPNILITGPKKRKQRMVATVRTANEYSYKSPDIPLFEAQVNDINVQVFVDTGCPLSVLNEGTASKLNLTVMKHVSEWKLKSISGDGLNILGMVKLPLQVFDTVIISDFLVVNGTFPGDLLVGYNFLAQNRINIQPYQSTISRDEVFIPLTISDQPQSFPASQINLSWTPNSDAPFARVLKDTFIHPCCACLVQVKTSVPGKSILLTPDGIRVKGLIAETAIYSPDKDRLQLRLMNATAQIIKLRKNTRVCDLEVSQLPLQVQEYPSFTACSVISDTSNLANYPTKSPTFTPQVGMPEAKEPLIELFARYPGILPGEDGAIGRAQHMQHTINLEPGSRPLYIPAYRLPHSRKEIMNSLTDEMLKQGIIESSSSPWSSPILLVPKPDGTFRPVIDYRGLNKLTIPDRFPVPILKDLLQDIGAGHTIFSTIDLSKGFWQVELDKHSRPLTAFTTPKGHFHFRRMPFGLRNAPIFFNRLMSITMSGLIGPTCLLYLDDLIVASQTIPEHISKLEAVFKRLADAGLTINPKKSLFFKSSIKYLGHIVDKHGLRPNNDKIVAITDFPQPKTVKQIKSFLGLIGFYRPFIKNFGKIAIPLTSMLCKDEIFEWSKQAEDAFKTLKTAITEAPVLIFPHYDLPFELTTDASSLGLGAVLMQRVNGRLHPIAFASRKTSRPESAYSATDLEFLGMVWGLKHFKEIIYGYNITVFTDHQPLTYSSKHLTGKHARWSNTLMEFDPTIKYTPGACNHVADALSRCYEPTLCTLNVLDPVSLKTSQRQQAPYDKIITLLENQTTNWSQSDKKLANPYHLSEGLLFRDSSKATNKRGNQRFSYSQLVIPDIFIPTVLHLLHEAPQAAHQGIDKAVKQARLKYFFPKQAKLISEHIKACQLCPYYKGHTHDPAPILSYDIPDYPFQRVSMDLLSGFVTSQNGNKSLLVCIDNFSRFTEIIPVPNKSADTIAKAFTEHIILRHDTPQEILSDSGSEFINSVMAALCTQFNIKHIRILPYRPQANGMTERLNRSILGIMRTLIPDDDYLWDEKIPAVQAAINSSFHSSLGDIPHFILYGRDKRLPYDILDKKPGPLYTSDYVPNMLREKQIIFQAAKAHLLKEKTLMTQQQHKIANNKVIKLGSLVFKQIRIKQADMPKLAPSFDGPFRIVEVKNNKALLLNLTTLEKSWAHVDILKSATDQFQARHAELT